MSKRMWKKVEAKVRRTRIAEAEERRKEVRRDETEEEERKEK